MVDEPTSDVKYGSVVAAPYVSELLEKILPYLEFKSSADEYNEAVNNYVGMNVNSVRDMLTKSKISYEIIGDGTTVLAQMPPAGDVITKPLSKVILYTTNEETAYTTVPNLVGLTLSEAVKLATNRGFNICLAGNTAEAHSGNDIVKEQSLPPGEKVAKGTLITFRAITTKHED